MVRVGLVGNVDPQTSAVRHCLLDRFETFGWVNDPARLDLVHEWQPDLLIVAGWRHLIPPDILAIPRLGTVGFHSAKLPEFPGRAPVPWTLLRADKYAYNTMLYLDAGVDSGDIIDERRVEIGLGAGPDDLYRFMAASAVDMLTEHLPALLAGTAPRDPQDPAKRGPLTTKDGWQRWERMPRYGP